MKNVLLGIWITIIVISATNRLSQEETIECDGSYFLSKIINTLVWCSFLMW